MTDNDDSMQPDEAFGQLGRIVLGEQPLDAILEQVVQLAVRVLPVQVQASITLIADGRPFTIAFSGDTALALDERQYELERGPCLDAAEAGNLVKVPDMRTESRWPRYTQAAIDRGVQSSLSVPLPVQRSVIGALNFYATGPNLFDEATIELAQTFAGHAAVAVANAHRYETTTALTEQMRQAMATRATIEQAKGIIMRDRGCGPDAAFEALVQLSQESHLKLREIAQRLVDDVSSGR
jgi:GAF domain-containing protein